ncbi:MAG: glutathione S-transferase family protein [Robiginitomaculum sp.]|nr:glutathione S-transferase family protein [Robiginitomaculum sp.]
MPKNQRNKLMADWAFINLKSTFNQFGLDLDDKEFITGDKFTAADISVGYVAYAMSFLGKFEEVAPENVIKWWQKLAERPALKKSLSL